MRYRTRGVATNKTPVGPYRAVGRPSASASLELLIDEMARRLKLDPVEVRMRNLIPLEAMPYRNANNLVHDNVNYVPCLKLSVAKSDYERLRAEQREGPRQRQAARHRRRLLRRADRPRHQHGGRPRHAAAAWP